MMSFLNSVETEPMLTKSEAKYLQNMVVRSSSERFLLKFLVNSRKFVSVARAAPTRQSTASNLQ